MNLLQEQLTLLATQFHWLRPWWLLSLIPVVLLGVLLWQQKRHSYQWQQIIAPELLPYLLDGNSTGRKKPLLWALIIAWCLATLALAGPSWIKRPIPVEKNQNALVILLDLSTSMVSEDIKPSRIIRARLKIADILRERKDGQTALVVYAGDAHTVTPISDDSATIASLLPSLHPNIMPVPGSNTEAAVARGIELLQDAGIARGDLLLITDGVVPEAFAQIQELLSHKNIRLNILGVGSSQAAPIASGNGGFVRDQRGAIITTQLNSAELNQLAQQLNGRYSDIASTNVDINHLIDGDAIAEQNTATLERDFDQWFDQGYWLVFLLLPIVLLSFKRGFILMLICVPLVGLTPNSAYAFAWDDIWQTKDQQAQQALSAGDAKKAAEQFKSPDWKAAAQYRAGDYKAAAQSFAQSDTASAHYNRGNALAKSGDLDGAIKAYDEALKRDPKLADAEKNRALVDAVKKQQQQQQKDSSDKNNQDQNKEQNKEQEQNKDGENQQDKDDSQQQNTNQQDKDSQSEENKDGQNSSQASAASQDQDKSQQQASSAANTESAGQASSASQQPSAAAGQGSSSAASAADQSLSQSSAESQDGKPPQQEPGEIDLNNLNTEQKQALEQWLRRVPDDPGGLLRNKFRWQYQQNREKRADGEYEPPKNNADQRL